MYRRLFVFVNLFHARHVREEEIVCADSDADVIVIAIGESDSEEIVTGT